MTPAEPDHWRTQYGFPERRGGRIRPGTDGINFPGDHGPTTSPRSRRQVLASLGLATTAGCLGSLIDGSEHRGQAYAVGYLRGMLKALRAGRSG